MALSKSTEDDKIEIVGKYKTVQIRTATVVSEDGVEISRTFKRRLINCCTKANGVWSNTDISGESSEIQAVCNGVWTDAIRTAYKARFDAS